jgi:ribonuclease VapC
MFVDASVLVAILKREPGHQDLARRLDSAADAITSPIAIVETVMSLAKQKPIAVETMKKEVGLLLERSGLRVSPIDEQTGDLAIEAHSRYGKGSGHPARLNLGDCFAYAMAKQHGVPLLYKGDDFSLTDLA